jgi:K+-sensing histidine kinase KdpD
VARRAAGAGIGLFVCKALIDAMAGRIWARERPGGGAEFGFALPGLVEPADGGTA